MPSATLVAVVAALALAAPATASDAAASNAVAAVKSYLDNLKTGLAADAALKPTLTFNASAPKPPLITPGVGAAKPGEVIKNLTIAAVEGWKIDLMAWLESAQQELAAAKTKAEALALAASYQNGTLAYVAAATLQRTKAEAIESVREKILYHLDSKINDLPNALDTLAIAAFVAAKTQCELEGCVNQARALGLLPLPLAAVETYVPGGVPLVVNSDGSGGTAPASGLGRRRRRLLQAFEPQRGRTLLQAVPSAATELEALESTLAKRALSSCCAAGIAVSQDAALAEVKRYLSGVPLKWDVDAEPLSESEFVSAARGYFFPCIPLVSLSVIEDNHPNVQRVLQLLPFNNPAAPIDWTRATYARYAQNGPAPQFGRSQTPAPTPSGPLTQIPEQEQLYINFLQTIARYPYFCGEQARDSDGTVLSLLDSCRRELAFLFANAAQETGFGAANPSQWPSYLGPYVKPAQQAFAFSRENSFYGFCDGTGPACNATACPQYDPWPWNTQVSSCGVGLPCTASTHFYGRGWHQTSYDYNYFAFGTISTPSDPMHLHEVVMSIYTPDDATFANTGTCTNAQPVNIKVSNGIVVNRFMTAISAINGAVECGSQVLQATQRTSYYIAWLALMGVPYASMTPDEQASLFRTPNDPSSGAAYCNVCNGDPFSTSFPELGWKKRFVLNLNCDPIYGNPKCKATADGQTPTKCVLYYKQDSYYNQLTYSPSKAACQAGPYAGCCCGNDCGPGGVNACPCCRLPQPFLALNEQSLNTCNTLVKSLQWKGN